ncbi:MAG: DUF4436 family protein [Deltaproteobacteria bacterium]|nr:DUF4436 family protein [Deltaproteobacteria bacterium]
MRKRVSVMLAVLLAAVMVVLVAYHRELHPEHVFPGSGSRDAGWLEAHVTVLAVEPEKEDIRLRVALTPRGKLEASAGVPRETIRVHADAVGWEEVDLEPGRRVVPRDLTLDLIDGEPTDYPFDRYRAELDLLAEVGEGAAAHPVAVDVRFDDSHHGFRFDTKPRTADDAGYGGFELSLRRSGLVLGMALFLMGITWGVTFVALRLLAIVIEGRIHVDVDVFVAFSGLVVAMYFFRSVLPELPPISGTLADFLAFLWAEAASALGVVVVGVLWLVHARPGQPSPKTTEEGDARAPEHGRASHAHAPALPASRSRAAPSLRDHLRGWRPGRRDGGTRGHAPTRFDA